jgi:hypothetical protein
VCVTISTARSTRAHEVQKKFEQLIYPQVDTVQGHTTPTTCLCSSSQINHQEQSSEFVDPNDSRNYATLIECISAIHETKMKSKMKPNETHYSTLKKHQYTPKHTKVHQIKAAATAIANQDG